jgi:hypothetical protein
MHDLDTLLFHWASIRRILVILIVRLRCHDGHVLDGFVGCYAAQSRKGEPQRLKVIPLA